MTDDPLATALARLRGRFLAEAVTQCARIEADLAALEGDGAPAALDHLRATAHRLAGSGGTLGFPTVSAAAADLEHCVDDCAGGPATEAVREAGGNLVGALRALQD